MSAKISQLACFSSTTNRQFHFKTRSFPCPRFRPESFVVRSVDGSSSEPPASLSYTAEVSKPFVEKKSKPLQRAAKIHDFCFGIPYGGLVMYGGLLGFAFSRNPSSLSTGVLYGGGLLALSTLSMKIWRQGKSSFPYILDQAVLSAVVFWKNFTAYSMTKKLFSAGLFSVVSAAMLCFYSYVVLSGGNPPPKKLKPSASPSY
ncbi:hypothetical protein Bca52824_047394 [Brassica carinata]|uniref:Protein FATTY ACID EXPORT 1, chloroplastic n=2 Tax=Brassica TaxID=3705 RepID=A0A8X7UPX7_BRACI|nr:hypothetical protein Bca52824_047394 [Brassica carinata]